MDLAGKAVGRHPSGHGVRLRERAEDLLGLGRQHPVQPHRVRVLGHGRLHLVVRCRRLAPVTKTGGNRSIRQAASTFVRPSAAGRCAVRNAGRRRFFDGPVRWT